MRVSTTGRVQTFVPAVKLSPIGTLQAAPFNPPRRTEDGAKLRQLEAAIVEVGGIIQPIITSSDFRIIDGHRRLAAAKNLGFVEVPIIVTPLSLQVGWRVLNQTPLGVNSPDWVQAMYRGMSFENLPTKEQEKLSEIKRLIGEDGWVSLAERNMATHVLQVAQYVAKYIEDRKGREKPSDEMTSKVLRWMIKFGQQGPARAAVRSGMNPRGLLYFIENGLEVGKM